MRQLDAFLEQQTPIYTASTTSGQQLMAQPQIDTRLPKISPPLASFDWFELFGLWHKRQSSPNPHRTLVYELLQSLILDGKTYDEYVFCREKSNQFENLCDEIFGRSIDALRAIATDGCALCRATILLQTVRLKDLQKHSYATKLNWRWFVSEISKLVVQISYSLKEPLAMRVLSSFTTICYLRGSPEESSAIVRAVIVLVDTFEAGSLEEQRFLLDLSGYAIMLNEAATGERLIKKVMGQNFELYNILPDFLDEVADQTTHDKEDLTRKLLFRRAASQISVVQWFQFHPRSSNRIFGGDQGARYLKNCRGIAINGVHICAYGMFVPRVLLVSSAARFYDQECAWIEDGQCNCRQTTWQIIWYLLRNYGDLLEENLSEGRATMTDDIEALLEGKFFGGSATNDIEHSMDHFEACDKAFRSNAIPPDAGDWEDNISERQIVEIEQEDEGNVDSEERRTDEDLMEGVIFENERSFEQNFYCE